MSQSIYFGILLYLPMHTHFSSHGFFVSPLLFLSLLHTYSFSQSLSILLSLSTSSSLSFSSLLLPPLLFPPLFFFLLFSPPFSLLSSPLPSFLFLSHLPFSSLLFGSFHTSTLLFSLPLLPFPPLPSPPLSSPLFSSISLPPCFPVLYILLCKYVMLSHWLQSKLIDSRKKCSLIYAGKKAVSFGPHVKVNTIIFSLLLTFIIYYFPKSYHFCFYCFTSSANCRNYFLFSSSDSL